MNVTAEIKGKNINIIIEGSVDTVTAPDLHKELSVLPVEDAETVMVDLSQMHYISSAGLRELLILQKRFPNGILRIQNVNETVGGIFEMTGFTHLFDICGSYESEEYNETGSLKEFLAGKVAQNRDMTIIEDRNISWTWGDLDAASDRIAEDLIGLGAKRGSHIAICGVNSLNWIAAFFAIQKLGGLAILVNPLLSTEEVCFLSQAGDIEFFCHGIGPWLKGDAAGYLKAITDPEKSSIRVLYDITRPIDPRGSEPSLIVRNFLDSIAVRSDDPCVMIFTSGSTGVPKGVLLSSYGMLTAATSPRVTIKISDNDVMCLALPLFHIFGLVASLLYSMLENVKTVIPEHIKPDMVLDTIEKYSCTFLFSVPTMFLGIASSPSYTPERTVSLRCGLTGGAPISDRQMLYLQKQFPTASFYTVYGLSEMSPVSFTKNGDSIEQLTKTVGTPGNNVMVRIENVETKEECAQGETGEILVRGVFLMSGYYKTPIEKQDFDSNGWFHTGDLGYLDEDGYIHFAGRKKELIIRGGENIYPGEIAEAATIYPPVVGVQVVGVPDDYYGEIVGCALMLRPGASFDEEDFRAHLANSLAPHKIPAVIAVYDEFPLLANGKTDVLTLKKEMAAKKNQ